MADTKKTKRASTELSQSSFADKAWESLFAVADDARAELHRQSDAAIVLAGGALQGLTALAKNINDRLDLLAQDGLISLEGSGRQLALATRDAARKLAESRRRSTAELEPSTGGAKKKAA